MKLLRPTLLTLACLLALPGHADDLPSLGDASSAIVSPQQEHQLGRAWLSLLRGQVNQLNDPQLKDYVETSVYKLAETSQLQDRRLEFILIDKAKIGSDILHRIQNIKDQCGVHMYAEVYKWFTETSGLGLMEQVAKLMQLAQASKEEDIAESI